MKQLDEIGIIVKDYVDDTTIDPDQHVIDAVNFLSNFFAIKSIKSDGTTTADQAYIARPTDCLRVNQLFIAGKEVKHLEDIDRAEAVRLSDTLRWYEYDGKIILTKTPSNSTDEVKIWYDKGFLEPTDSVATDVPEKYLELVYVGATYRYYRKIVSQVVKNRQDYPNVNPKEIKAIRDQWKGDFDSLLKQVQGSSIPI